MKGEVINMINICPVCQKVFENTYKGKAKRMSHIHRKRDPHHQLVSDYMKRYPSASFGLFMREMKSQWDALIENYGPPRQYGEVIHEDDPILAEED
jgi:hypothetical protein